MTLNVYPQSRAEDIQRARNYLAMVRKLRAEGVRPGNVAYWLNLAGNLRRAIRTDVPAVSSFEDDAEYGAGWDEPPVSLPPRV